MPGGGGVWPGGLGGGGLPGGGGGMSDARGVGAPSKGMPGGGVKGARLGGAPGGGGWLGKGMPVGFAPSAFVSSPLRPLPKVMFRMQISQRAMSRKCVAEKGFGSQLLHHWSEGAARTRSGKQPTHSQPQIRSSPLQPKQKQHRPLYSSLLSALFMQPQGHLHHRC